MIEIGLNEVATPDVEIYNEICMQYSEGEYSESAIRGHRFRYGKTLKRNHVQMEGTRSCGQDMVFVTFGGFLT